MTPRCSPAAHAQSQSACTGNAAAFVWLNGTPRIHQGPNRRLSNLEIDRTLRVSWALLSLITSSKVRFVCSWSAMQRNGRSSTNLHPRGVPQRLYHANKRCSLTMMKNILLRYPNLLPSSPSYMEALSPWVARPATIRTKSAQSNCHDQAMRILTNVALYRRA
jgi:hypothetical protein